MAQHIEFIVTDPLGLYAAPATELIDFVKRFYSELTLCYEGKKVNLKSMMGVVSLGVPTKAKLEIIADGVDEERAINEIKIKIKELGISSGE